MKIYMETEDLKKEIKNNLPSLPSLPNRDDVITIDGEDYEVQGIVFDLDNDEIIIEVS